MSNAPVLRWGFLDPNPRDFSNCMASVRTEVKVKPRSRDTKHALPWGGMGWWSALGRKDLGPGAPITTQGCRLEQAGGCIGWEEILLISFRGKDGE